MSLPCDLLVSGSRYWSLFDAQQQRHTRLDEGRGPYYGISWSGEELFVLARNRGLGEQILVYNEELNPVRTLDIGRSIDAHQILFACGAIFVTATRENALLKVDPFTGRQESINWTGHHTDINHINALGMADPGCLWVSHDNKKGAVSEVVKLDLQSTSIIERHPIGTTETGTHNVEQGFVLASGADSTLWRMSADGNPEVFYVVHKAFCRGLAFATSKADEGCIMVGLSEILERGQRGNPHDGCIHVIGADSRKLVSEIIVPEIGQVHDVRSLGSDSHNGIACPPLSGGVRRFSSIRDLEGRVRDGPPHRG